MSATMTVPAAVPSLFQISLPCAPSLAMKNSVPPITVRYFGIEPVLPGLMSAIMTVPAVVPSDFQSSSPCVPSLAWKNSVPLKLVR